MPIAKHDCPIGRKDEISENDENKVKIKIQNESKSCTQSASSSNRKSKHGNGNSKKNPSTTKFTCNKDTDIAKESESDSHQLEQREPDQSSSSNQTYQQHGQTHQGDQRQQANEQMEGGGQGSESVFSSGSSTGSESQRSGSSCSSASTNKCSRLLLCGGGTSESKRKDVDESNVNGAGPSEPETGQSSKGRKSFRKGSKKKEKPQAAKENTRPGSSDANTTHTGDIQFCEDSNNENGITAQSAHDKNSNKSCCFCWCCCCSCSCLSVKKNQGKANKESNKLQSSLSFERCLNGNGEQPPSLEEIRLWAESFDRLMKCPWGRKVFRDFLKCEYSEENILFWLACEDLKKETNPEVIEEKARVIYEDYISILSPKEVSLDSRVREIINKNMVEPSPRTFDEAQLQIYTLMHRDSYPRFINSPMFRKLAQLPSPSRKSSSA